MQGFLCPPDREGQLQPKTHTINKNKKIPQNSFCLQTCGKIKMYLKAKVLNSLFHI